MKELREAINNATLTKTQKMIARYILDNSADACFMTSTEIAEQLGVSESSVIRFSRSRSSQVFWFCSISYPLLSCSVLSNSSSTVQP